jgi:hypothetical protein
MNKEHISLWGKCEKHNIALRIKYHDNGKTSTYCKNCETDRKLLIERFNFLSSELIKAGEARRELIRQAL